MRPNNAVGNGSCSQHYGTFEEKKSCPLCQSQGTLKGLFEDKQRHFSKCGVLSTLTSQSSNNEREAQNLSEIYEVLQLV